CRSSLGKEYPASSGPRLLSLRSTAPISATYASTGTGTAVGPTLFVSARAFSTADSSSTPLLSQHAPNPLDSRLVVWPASAPERHLSNHFELFGRHSLILKDVLRQPGANALVGGEESEHVALALWHLEGPDELPQCFLRRRFLLS